MVHGTHNGAKSVVHELAREDFPRIRVGIGKPQEDTDMIEYVIGKLGDEQYNSLKIGIEKAMGAAIDYIKEGIDFSMNKWN